MADAVRLREVGTVERTTHNKVGDVTASVDGLGNETISLYDRRGRQTSVYEPLRDTGVTPHRPSPTDNPTGSDWTTVSDNRAYGGSYLRASSGSSTYPTYTMAVPSLSYYPTLAVMATWTPDPANISNAQFKVYDNFNNLIGSIYVDQTVAPGDYRDETGRWWQVLGVYQMIPFNTAVKVTPQVGAQADAARLIEVGDRSFKNTYNAAGELTQVTDAKNNDTWFYRDDLGRVKEEKNELNESRYFEFYADSRLKKATDRNGRVIENFYDNLGRQTEERWKNGAATVRSLTFGYDSNGQLKTADDDGTSARDYDWLYDELGRLTETEFSAQGYLWEFKNGYDGNSNRDVREAVLDSSAALFTDAIEYDDLNRLTKLTRDADLWGHDLRAEFDYTAAGQLDEIRRFNVTTGGTAFVTSHYGYDGMGRLTSLDHKNSSSVSITGYGWTYDAASRMTSMDFTNSTYNAEDVATFGYDRTNQLLSGERTGTSDDEAYAYDGAGNRTTANGSTYTTTSNNRLTNDGTFTYTYDDEGNRLTRVRISGAAADDKTAEYLWDYRNRLEKVTFKRNDGTVTKTVEFRYDMFNQVTQRVIDPDGALGSTPTQTEDYLWDGDELVGVYGYRSLVFAYGPAPDMVLFESEDTIALHALLGDHQNTVRDVISTSGTVENHLVYNSYGELKSQTGGGAYSPFHRFTGKPFDVAIGLQYNVNRWYDPVTGRWTSEDPIGFGGGDANLYSYVENDPTSGTDPDGQQRGGTTPRQTYQSRGGGIGYYRNGPFRRGDEPRTFPEVRQVRQWQRDDWMNRPRPQGGSGATNQGPRNPYDPNNAPLGPHIGRLRDLGRLPPRDARGESAELRPYGGPGGGHHVGAQSAFRGAPGYNPKTALAIPNAALAALGVDHFAVTGAQMVLYRAFAAAGGTLTWGTVAQIEAQALIRGGMQPAMAQATVWPAIQFLINSGVTGPTRIPWGG